MHPGTGAEKKKKGEVGLYNDSRRREHVRRGVLSEEPKLSLGGWVDPYLGPFKERQQV